MGVCGGQEVPRPVSWITYGPWIWQVRPQSATEGKAYNVRNVTTLVPLKGIQLEEKFYGWVMLQSQIRFHGTELHLSKKLNRIFFKIF